jgi:hypothetical protein
MAQVKHIFAKGLSGRRQRLSAPIHHALRQGGQTAQSAQQTGFARAVFTLQMQGLTGLQLKANRRKQLPTGSLHTGLQYLQ